MRIQLSDHFTYGRLFKFVAPSIVMMVFVSVYGVVDGLFMSNFVGEMAVAATNYIFPVIIFFGAIGFMIGTGGSALVAKILGEGDRDKANAYFTMLVFVTLGIGVAISVAAQFAVPSLARVLCKEEETYEYCVLYGRIMFAGQPFFILQNIFQSFFVTAEKPRLGLAVTAVAGVANMALDALFVVGFKWGIAGAAAATVVSEVVGGVLPIIYFARKNGSILRFTKTRFYGKALLKSVTNGSSEFFSNVSVAVVMMLYNFKLRQLVGDEGVAAYGAIGYIETIFFAIFMGYAVGSAPLMGYNFGAQNRDEMKNLFKKSLIIMATAGVVMTGLSEALAYPMIKIFGYKGELFDMTLRGLRIYAMAFLLTGFSVYGSSLFTALNNGLVSGIISFLGTCVFRIATVFVLPLLFGLDGIWAAKCFAEILSGIVVVVFILCYRKKYGYA